jgi:diacylglycerol kinase family enzyme
VNILLLHNPTAGNDRPSERELVAMLRNARHDVSCVATDDPQLAHRMVEKVDLLLIAGGDGTVATVLEKVEGGSAPIGILPLGTANNLARTFGISGEIEEVIEGLAGGELAPVDFGIADGPWGRHRFFESTGFGAIAEALGPVNAARVPSAEKIPSGRRALRETFSRMAPIRLQVTIDGERHDDSLLMLELARIDTFGPRLRLAPDATPGDGTIHVVTLAPETREAMLAWLEDPDGGAPAPVQVRRARQVEVGWEDTSSHFDDNFFERPEQPCRMKATIQHAAVRILRPVPRGKERRR